MKLNFKIQFDGKKSLRKCNSIVIVNSPTIEYRRCLVIVIFVIFMHNELFSFFITIDSIRILKSAIANPRLKYDPWNENTCLPYYCNYFTLRMYLKMYRFVMVILFWIWRMEGNTEFDVLVIIINLFLFSLLLYWTILNVGQVLVFPFDKF